MLTSFTNTLAEVIKTHEAVAICPVNLPGTTVGEAGLNVDFNFGITFIML